MDKRTESNLFLLPKHAEHDTNGWSRRHMAAVRTPRPGHERAYVDMLRGWLEYSGAHEERFESRIGDDCVLGPSWAKIGAGLRELLNGETGRLDCGTLDALIADAIREQELDPDD